MHFDETHWTNARNQMARNEKIINLNAGTLSPTPLPIMARCNELRQMMAENPSDFFWRQTKPLLNASRDALGKYLNCPSSELLLLPNVTNAMNIAIRSLDLPAGSEILATNHEYGAILNAWKVEGNPKGWKTQFFEIPHLSDDPADYVRAFKKAVTPKTKILFFSHVAFTTGLLLPAKELCAAARELGIITVIDGAHAPGGAPVDLSEINADFYGANLHKWLMCPAGAGFLHAQPKHHEKMKPVVVSWGYPYDFSTANDPCDAGGTKFQWSLEYQGITDRSPQMVMPEVITFRNSIGGEDAIHARVRELGDYAIATIGKILKPSIPNNPARRGPIVSFEFPKCDPVAARNRLYGEFGIECPVTQVGEQSFLRVSTAWFNTTAELDKLRDAIQRVI